MKSDYTHIAMVLDRSGSMASIASDTIGGVNTFLEAQRKAPGECTATLVQFDDVIETVIDGKRVAEVKPLDKETYVPRNSTALYDAVGRTIVSTGDYLMRKAESDRPGKVIFAIITDGYENASREYNRAKVFDMIKHQREVYKWEFVFIGANQDALAEGESIGIARSHSINYAANPRGTQVAYASMAANTVSMRCGLKQDMSWKDEDRKAQADAGAQTTT
jgi:hypothetical protein